ncbi:MAG: efflux RND transporter periplasmic adaptor subunit [Vicinamibacterales bacterium]
MNITTRIGLAALLAAVPACSAPEPSATAAAASAPPSRSGSVVRFEPSSPQLERIRVAAVADAVLPVEEFEIPGKVEAVPTRLARLALPVPGRVRNVSVTLGDRVRQGQVLATIDTPDASELQSLWRQAQADVRQREAAIAKAEADLRRMRDLLANRATAQKEVLAAETDLAMAVAAREQAHATLDDVARRRRLFGVADEQTDAGVALRSPINGEVLEIAVAPGEYRSDTSEPIVTVADLSRVWVVAFVPERAIARIETDQVVTVAVSAYPDQPFTGRVARVAGALDPETRSIRVIVELDNDRRLLKPEMFARVRYSGPARAVVTTAPGAIVQDQGRTTVFVERAAGEFERREVSVGPRRDDAVVVTRGLTSGDRVVVAGTMLLMGQ